MAAAVPLPYRAFRTLVSERGDALHRLGRDGIYDRGRMMAPGGLLLLERMVGMSGLQPGSRVLDLGCGRAQSSCYLASECGCFVTALDLWTPADQRLTCGDESNAKAPSILHLTGDFRRGLPAGSGPFDAVVALQSFHAFGANRAAIRYAARLLRSGGKLVLGQTCFSRRPVLDAPPFNACGGFHTDYATYQTLAWWRDHIESEHQFRTDHAEECSDGDVMWEDHFLYMGERAGWSREFLVTFSWLGEQIRFGRKGGPHLTHLMLSATKL